MAIMSNSEWASIGNCAVGGFGIVVELVSNVHSQAVWIAWTCPDDSGSKDTSPPIASCNALQ